MHGTLFLSTFTCRFRHTHFLWFNFASESLSDRTFSIVTGGKAASLALGGDALGGNGCVEIGEAGTEGEWRKYESASLTTVLLENCSAVDLRQEDG